MKVAIMQPYVFPYIGYFQLINAVDKFVVYDNIKFTKKGWIHRNRILSNGKDFMFSLSLKKDSDFLDIDKRFLSKDSLKNRQKILRKILNDYKKAPHFNDIYPLLEKIFNYHEKNLFKFIYNSIIEITRFLNLKTEIIISSTLPIDHSLKSQDKVIAICKHLKAKEYYNPLGGKDLYNKGVFSDNSISLFFLKSIPIEYNQFDENFIPWLSIIDVMMFNSKPEVISMLNDFELI